MPRILYLSALIVLQLAVLLKLAAPLGRALSVESAPGIATEGWQAMLQLALTATAVTGASVALVFPGLALSRHACEGSARFFALPRWSVALALLGAAMLAGGALTPLLWPPLPVGPAVAAAWLARSVAAAGFALVAAGVLGGELLVAEVPIRAPRARSPRRTGRIEVTHPPELRTRAVRTPVT